MSAKRKNTTVETGPAAKAQAVAAAGDAPGYASGSSMPPKEKRFPPRRFQPRGAADWHRVCASSGRSADANSQLTAHSSQLTAHSSQLTPDFQERFPLSAHSL
jgi:hypothetical protein